MTNYDYAILIVVCIVIFLAMVASIVFQRRIYDPFEHKMKNKKSKK